MTDRLSGAAGPLFGSYGGRYVPEALMAALDELTDAYDKAQHDPGFHAEIDRLARDYTGRPSILTEAPRFCAALWRRAGVPQA